MKREADPWLFPGQPRTPRAGLQRQTPPSPAAEPASRDVALAYQLHFATSVNPAQQAGFWVLMAYLFLATSRLPEFFTPGLRIPLVLACCGFVAALVGGGVFRLIRLSVALLYAGLTIWLAMGIPFSLWKGGSIEVFLEDWLKSLLVFVMLVTLIHTSRQALTAIGVIAWGSLVLVMLAYWRGVEGPDGRLMLPIGQYSNPNDLAYGLLMAVMFWWYMVANPGRSAVVRILGLGVLAAVFPLLVRTGSRAAMIVVAVALPMLLFQRALAGRLQLFFVGIVLLIAAVAALPSGLRDRYVTFLSPQDAVGSDQPMTGEQRALVEAAAGSAQGRKQLLLDSLKFTFQHTVFGVGVGMFAVAEDQEAVTSGNRGMWRGTHNTYTQLSSEAGIPALIFLVAILVLSFRILRRMEKVVTESRHPHRQQTSAAAAMLRSFLLATSVGLMFIHLAYTPLIPTLVGVVFGLGVCTLVEVKAAEGAARAIPAARPYAEANRSRAGRR